MRYREKIYRDYEESTRWTPFRVKVDTTDLLVRAHGDFTSRTGELVKRFREEILNHISRCDDFLTSLSPLPEPHDVPEIVARMYRAGQAAGVGPMAAVAGAIAESLGHELLRDSGEIIIENGGDIWLYITEPATVKLFTGNMYFTDSLSLHITPERTPCAICTSSGRMGHSLSFGRADTATILSQDASLADAMATATCNRVQGEDDLPAALDFAMNVTGITGAVIIFRDRLAAQGDIEFIR